jgi:hypothetical protein
MLLLSYLNNSCGQLLHLALILPGFFYKNGWELGSHTVIEKLQYSSEYSFGYIAPKDSMAVGVKHNQFFILGTELLIYAFAAFGVNHRIIG